MDVMHAIADPVRRRILEQLRAGAAPAGAIAAGFDISRPAISRHLRLLGEAGLVSVQEQGRERVYQLESGRLEQVQAWLDGFAQPWDRRLDALATEVHRTRRERERAGQQPSDTQEATA